MFYYTTMKKWYYWNFWGAFVAQPLTPALSELEQAFELHYYTQDFQDELKYYQKHYCGRPTMMTHLKNISTHFGGAQIVLKREDMTCVGAHKINHSIVQWLLAKRMWKKKLIAETGAGMHGTSTAVVAAMLGMQAKIFMWAEDMKRQAPNVQRMKLLWAEVVEVKTWSQTLKDAVNEAMKYYLANLSDSYFLLWSAVWPHPYPFIVAESQSVVGKECITQFPELMSKSAPDYVIACVWGWCNSIWIFSAYLENLDVKLVWVEWGGRGISKIWEHACRFEWTWAKEGVFHGYKSLFLQTNGGNIAPTHSISAGLDYPWVWPQHVDLYTTGRATYTYATDDEVMQAVKLTAQKEGIISALESAHALAYAYKLAPELSSDQVILVNLSGRWDKDMHTIIEYFK